MIIVSREILFRGQTRKKGEKVRLDGTPIDSNWVYGCGVFEANDDIAIIYQSKPELKKYSVYRDTVCQYTGMNDINGNKIYEGDIVHCKARIDHANMFVTFEDGKFVTVLCEEFKTHKRGLGHYEIECFDKEVVGNIYDNPELIDKAIAKSKLRNYEILA